MRKKAQKCIKDAKENYYDFEEQINEAAEQLSNELGTIRDNFFTRCSGLIGGLWDWTGKETVSCSGYSMKVRFSFEKNAYIGRLPTEFGPRDGVERYIENLDFDDLCEDFRDKTNYFILFEELPSDRIMRLARLSEEDDDYI